MFTFMEYQLDTLDLTGNAITIVNFSHAMYLPKTLYLFKNKVSQFITPVGKSHQIKTHIDALDLRHNGITNLNDTYFQFPQHLKRLYLDCNNIQGVLNEKTMTKTIQNTVTVYFNYNNITIINHDYLPEITFLRYNPYLYKVESNSTKLKKLFVKGRKQFARGIKSSDFKYSNVTVF